MLKTFVFSVALMLACVVPAFAQKDQQCVTPEAMTARMKGEGQRSFAHADYPIGNGGANGIIFTVNADLSIGYVLRADRPMGERASKICVYQRFVKLRLFDARAHGAPIDAGLSISDALATRQCEQLVREGIVERGDCHPFSVIVSKVRSWGHRFLFQGLATHPQPDGAYKETGSLLTVSGVVGGKLSDDPSNPLKAVGGTMTHTLIPGGASIIDLALMFVEFTPYGLSLLPR